MASLASINIRFSADLKEFSNQMQNAKRQIEKTGKEFQDLGGALTLGLTAPIIGFGVASVLAFNDSAQAIAQVDAALKSTGGTVGYTSDQLQKMASDLQAVTTFDDDEILKKATANLLTFSKITGQTFQEAQKAALDLATRLDGDLQGAAIQVGKALNDPVKGISALSKVGVSFSESQKATIKSMVATNDVAGAQALILKELNKEFGGSAEAAAKAGTGSFLQLANQLGDLSEEFGAIIVEALQPFVEGLKSVVSYFQSLSPEAKKVIVVVAAIAAAIGPLIIVLGTVITLLPTLAAGFVALTGPIGLVIAGLAAIAYVIANNWDVVKQTVVDVANYFIELYNSSLAFRAGIQGIAFAFKTVWTAAKTAFANILAFAQFTGRNVFNAFSSIGKLIKAVLTFDVAGIKTAFKEAFGGAKESATTLFNDIKNNAKEAGKEVKENLGTAIDNTLKGKKIEKITIAKDDVDATGVKDSVSGGIVAGAEDGATKATKIIKEKLEGLDLNFGTDASSGTISSYDAEIAKLNEFINTVATTPAQVQAAADAIKQIEFNKALQFDPTSLIEVSGGFDAMVTKMQSSANLATSALAETGAVIKEITKAMGDGFITAFDTLSTNVVDSLGLAKDGFEGFVGGMAKTIQKLIVMMLSSALSQSIAGAAAAGTATGPAAIFTTPAFIATAVGGIIAAFAAIPKFATGGIVGGSNLYGDKILARVNSGELILNNKQQKAVFNQMSSATGGAVNVTLGGGFEIEGTKLRLVLDRTDDRKNRIG